MKTQSVDVLRSKPGIYVALLPGLCCFIDVDPDGRCYRVNIDDFARDTELAPGDWNPSILFVGPFARVMTEVQP